MSTDVDVVVAGGGIAGLTAALHAARLGRSTLLLTGDQLGGHLLSIESIDGFPGYPEGVAGFELCPITQEQAVDAGAEIRMDEILDFEAENNGFRLHARDGEVHARALVLATGTSMRKLGVPGEEDFVGKGMSHCASCDAPLMRGRPVIVVGGGDSALQEALTLAEAAETVHVIHKNGALSAQAAYVRAAGNRPNIQCHAGAEVEEILGGGTVTGVRVRQNAGTAEMEAAGVFVYIGLTPNAGFAGDKLALAENGGVTTDAALMASLPGVFAAGTVRAGAAGRAAAAAGEGAQAALSAHAWLRMNES